MPSDAQTFLATQFGYTLRGVTPTCLLVVRGSTPMFLDLTSRPLRVREADGESADLQLEIDAADVAEMLPGKERMIEEWIASGRIQARGDAHTVSRLRARVRGGLPSVRYEEVADFIADPRFVFINHGFVELDGADTFEWVKPGDEPWRYNLNLIRELVRGVSLEGARVLDVGCGRGGTCSYLVRYHAPADVVGVDLILGQVEFCQSTHHAPNLRFQQADAQKLPFADGSFDVVTNIESSHCYPDRDAFYSEVRRVLRPGGSFCYTDNLPGGTVDDRTTQLRAYGDVRRVRTITAEVIEALTQCREPFMALVDQMVRDAGDHGAYVKRFASDILQCRNNYVAGAWDYAIWHVVRV
jgi:SAM-dependent methyltransferase